MWPEYACFSVGQTHKYWRMLLSPIILTTVMLWFLFSPKEASHTYSYLKIQQQKGGHTLHPFKNRCIGSLCISGLIIRFCYWFQNLLMVLGLLNYQNCFLPDKPSCTLRSSNTGLLVIPNVRTQTHREALLCYYGQQSAREPEGCRECYF